MKLTIAPLVALGLITTVPAGAQGVPPVTDLQRENTLPRTRQERELGLEGRPRGQEEQPAPDDDGLDTVEPEIEDDDWDVVPGVRPRQPGRF